MGDHLSSRSHSPPLLSLKRRASSPASNRSVRFKQEPISPQGSRIRRDDEESSSESEDGFDSGNRMGHAGSSKVKMRRKTPAQDHHGSNDSSDEDEKIPKPSGEVGRPQRGGYNLKETLKWASKDFEEVKVTYIGRPRKASSHT